MLLLIYQENVGLKKDKNAEEVVKELLCIILDKSAPRFFNLTVASNIGLQGTVHFMGGACHWEWLAPDASSAMVL